MKAAMLLDAFTESTEGLSVLLLQDHYGIGEIEVILFWETQTTPMKTREGYLIMEQLMRFGITNHATWQVVQERSHTDTGSMTQKKQTLSK